MNHLLLAFPVDSATKAISLALEFRIFQQNSAEAVGHEWPINIDPWPIVLTEKSRLLDYCELPTRNEKSSSRS